MATRAAVATSAADFIPARPTLSSLGTAAAECRGCHLRRHATQTLVGEGHPRVIVALGATAAQALLGNKFRVTEQRGRLVSSPWAEAVIATVHPSAVLRAPGDVREQARREFFEDLAQVERHLEGGGR